MTPYVLRRQHWRCFLRAVSQRPGALFADGAVGLFAPCDSHLDGSLRALDDERPQQYIPTKAEVQQ